MADRTTIEWTRSEDGTPGSTWNPLRGVAGKWHCSKVSPGCAHCFAERINVRWGGPDYLKMADSFRLDEDALRLPLRWRRPRMVFVCSMTDLFHEDVPDEYIDQVFAVMAMCPLHTFQVLTKRAERMRQYVLGADGREFKVPFGEWQREPFDWPLPNVWCGVSVEDQARADERIPHLLGTPAAVRFLSCEPLLGPVDLATLPFRDGSGSRNPLTGQLRLRVRGEALHPDCEVETRGLTAPRLHWVICGGESGPGARPCEAAWVRSLVMQCRGAGTACFVKQLGAHVLDTDVIDVADHWPDGTRFAAAPRSNARVLLRDPRGGDPAEWASDLRVREFPGVKGA